jgi:hypothetical protein
MKELIPFCVHKGTRRRHENDANAKYNNIYFLRLALEIIENPDFVRVCIRDSTYILRYIQSVIDVGGPCLKDDTRFGAITVK